MSHFVMTNSLSWVRLINVTACLCLLTMNTQWTDGGWKLKNTVLVVCVHIFMCLLGLNALWGNDSSFCYYSFFSINSVLVQLFHWSRHLYLSVCCVKAEAALHRTPRKRRGFVVVWQLNLTLIIILGLCFDFDRKFFTYDTKLNWNSMSHTMQGTALP